MRQEITIYQEILLKWCISDEPELRETQPGPELHTADQRNNIVLIYNTGNVVKVRFLKNVVMKAAYQR
jgi:hypothetical protein